MHINLPSLLSCKIAGLNNKEPPLKRQAITATALFCFLNIAAAAPADHFVTTWKTDNFGTSNTTSITVPMVGGPYDVDWDNDGTFDELGITGSVTYDYGIAGTNTIRIWGTYDSIQFNDGGDKEKILSIDQWGTNSWTSMDAAFFGAVHLHLPATDYPDFSLVTNMASMFQSATAANPDTSGWDTSSVTSMGSMFFYATSANPNTSGWDTSSVNDMMGMFGGATSANPDTSGWDTSSVLFMNGMFGYTALANPDTSGWDTSAVKSMRSMFQHATAANPNTSGWDTSSVTSMALMFLGATASNPDTSGWDTSSVTSMSSMFRIATSANPDTSGWDTSSVTNMSSMFRSATSANPDTSGWNTGAVTYLAGMFYHAISANPDTGNWDTSSVTSMERVFQSARSANPDTSNWDTSAVSNMMFMFYDTGANPDVEGWDTSSVTNMSSMFAFNYSANPNVSSWDTGAVTDTSRMFQGATSFDQNIGSWVVTALTDAVSMLQGVTLSTANYESLLIGWNDQVLQSGIAFSGGNSSYCSAAAYEARTNMITSDSWGIYDGGQACPNCNDNTISGVTEYFDAAFEACEMLTLGPSFIAADGSSVSLSSGWTIDFLPGFTVETGATLSTKVCGQSLCMTSVYPMPYGCHSCVDQICDIEPTCCELEFDQACLSKVDTVCGLVCE